MSDTISILGWSATGLRCPDHELKFTPRVNSKPYPVSLIQMPNGTGKTTTLTLLRAALSGAADSWTPAQISQMRRSTDSSPAGKFVVKLSVNDKPLTFELVLNYAQGTAAYRTSVGAGARSGFHPPRAISRFLTPRFIDLFIFDGELANNLTDGKYTRAREAIDALFQLTTFDDLARLVNKHWEDHVQKVGMKGDKALSQRRNKLEGLEARLASLQKEQKKLRADVLNLREEVKRSGDEYNTALAKDKDIGKRLEEVRTKLTEAKHSVNRRADLAIASMRSPHHLSDDFGRGLQLLKANLDKLKLPTSTSKEFFEELALADACICGRKMDDDIRQEIRSRVKLYLAEDEAGVLNSIKSDISKFCDQAPEFYLGENQAQLSNLADAVRQRDEFATELAALEQQRLSQGDSELEELKSRLDSLRGELAAKQRRLDGLERQPDDDEPEDTDCIKALVKMVKDAREDVAEATSTVELNRKTQVAVRIIKQSQTSARESLRGLLLSETNKRITQLLVRDPVLLEDIRDSLVLRGQEGASVGQTLSVGYAFLATLFGRSDYDLPFVVDSPVGSLDNTHRSHVARLIPKLCKQFIAFTISTERERFVPRLAEAANGRVQYLTLFRQSPATADMARNAAGKTTTTKDGVIVEGEEFFNSFDLEEETTA